MVRSLTGFQGNTVRAVNGDVGTVTRFLVDPARWVVEQIAITSGPGDADLFVSPRLVVGETGDGGLRLSAKTDEIRQASTAPSASCLDSAEIFGAHLEAIGGPVGHVDNFLVDPDTWHVRYVVVDPRNWWLGKHVLICPEWIERYTPSSGIVRVNVERDTIKAAPEYDAAYLLTREDEEATFRHYQRRPYWAA